jgi:lysophospholipase L1-like esterase
MIQRRIVVFALALAVAGHLPIALARAPSGSLQSVAWEGNLPDGSTTVVGGDDYQVESANRGWSASKAVDFPGLTRFELQHGDIWTVDQGRRPPKERSELGGRKSFDEGSDIWISYSMLIESGRVSTAKAVLLGQLHHVDESVATTAPYSVWLNRGDRLSIETWASAEDPLLHNPLGRSRTLFSRSSFERDRWHNFVHHVRFGHDGSGTAQVWIDGVEVAHYSGRLGYVGQYYWKFGIYRDAAPEQLAVQYANMEVSGDSLAARIDQPRSIYAQAPSGELPQLPLAPGAKLVGLGDSIVRINHQTSGTTGMSTTGIGQLIWARALDPRFRFETWADPHDPVDNRGFNGANQGLDGDHTVAVRGGVPGLLSRVPYALARHPAIVYVQVGTNDINSHDSAAQVETHLDQILTRLRSANVWVLLSTIWPRVTSGGVAPWPARDPRWRIRQAVNAWIASQAGRDGVRIIDPNPQLVDRSASSGEEEWLPGYSTDGVHPAPPAAYHAALAVNAALADMISPGITFDPDPRAANLMDGTLGGAAGMAGKGVRGPIADHWTAVVSGGFFGIAASSKVEAHKEAMADGLEKQVFAISAIDDMSPNSYHTLDFTYDPEISFAGGDAVEGDWIEAAMYVEVAPWDGWVDISLTLALRDGWKARSRADAMLPHDRRAQRWPSEGWKGWLLSDPVQITPGANIDTIRTSLSFATVEFLKGAGGTGTIKLSRPIVRKISDPRSDWNLAAVDAH